MSKTVYFGVGLIPLALPRLILALGLERALLFSLQSPGNSYRPLWSDDHYDYYPTSDNGMAQIPYIGNRAQGTRIYQ